MGSRFTLRIPLYGEQDAIRWIDGLAKIRCWLAVRNASLADLFSRCSLSTAWTCGFMTENASAG